MEDNAKTKPVLTGEEILTYAQHGEAGAGNMFVRLFKDLFLAEKVTSRGSSKNCWYRYNGQYWQQDKLDDVLIEMRSTQNIFADEIARISRESERGDKNTEAKIQRLETAAARLDKHSFCMNAALIAAEGSTTLAFDGERFDKQKNKIPCENGILDPAKCDIEDGKIVLESKKAWRDMRPDDYVRYVCTAFNPEAECPAWNDFLTDALDGDTDEGREVIDFLQVLVGYSLLGDPRQDVLIIKDSPNGRSGKGVFDKAIQRAFGSLGVTAKSGLFLKKIGNDPNKPEPALMALKDKRIVMMSEQGKGEVYDAAEVKTKTSGRDPVPARGLYGEETNFMPTYVFWQSTNDLPRVSADDGAFWARVIRVRFPHHYCKNPDPHDPAQRHIDTGLEERLEAETQGILNWCIKGAIRYIQNGYQLPAYPKLVLEAIAEYRQHEDSLADFIEERCVTSERAEVQSGELYSSYRDWCNECGRRANSQKTFKDAIIRRGFDWVRRKGGSYFLGVGLLQN